MAKIWLRLNEWAGCCLGNHLVADHPEIKAHLSAIVAPEKISTIAYGADRIISISADPVIQRGLEPGRYLILVARPEPENSILEVVSGFSARHRGMKLAVLGHYKDNNPYHRAVKSAAGGEIVFLDAIYHKPDVPALRYHAAAYVHGHQVGGTNPSLVEALGVGNPVIAHDNRFNQWVAGDTNRNSDGRRY
jgi:glycosyltransferase involved in cell wall biosynthesis